jgi:autotransporter-associated beta strand protein
MKTFRTSTLQFLGLSAWISMLFTMTSGAQTWSGDGADANWSTGGNWSGGTPPAASSTITLTFGATSKLTSTNNIANLGFDGSAGGATMNFTSAAGAYVLNGTQQIQKLELTIASGAAGITINLPLYIRNSTGGLFTINNTAVNTINGIISGFGASNAVFKQGTGTLQLTADNTFTGITQIREGTLRVSKIGNAATAGNLGTNGTIQVGNLTTSGTLEYVGAGETINRQIQIGSGTATANTGGATILSSGAGALQFSNSVFNVAVSGGVGTPARTLTLGGTNSGANTISGVIQNNEANKSISLTKTDAGKWVLGGNNTYSGTTIISGGTLIINGDQGDATGAVSVAAGATLGGSGILGGSTVINGILSPGNSIGTLTIENNVTWNFTSGNAWVFELGSAGVSLGSPGTSDMLSIDGNFIKGTGSSFTFDFANTGAAGWYQLVSWTGSGATFNSDNFLATNLAGSLTGSFHLESDGLYLQVIPEPSTALLIVLGLGAVFLRRKLA